MFALHKEASRNSMAQIKLVVVISIRNLSVILSLKIPCNYMFWLLKSKATSIPALIVIVTFVFKYLLNTTNNFLFYFTVKSKEVLILGITKPPHYTAHLQLYQYTSKCRRPFYGVVVNIYHK